MTEQQLQMHAAIPGAVAAWYRGDGEGAALLVQAALDQSHPHLVVMETIQMLTFGWLGILDQHDIHLDLEDVETYWNHLAQAIATTNT